MCEEKSNVSFFSGLSLLAIACFAAGLFVAQYKIFPYQQVVQVAKIAQSLLQHGEVIGEGRRRLAPAGAARAPVTVHDADAAIGEGFYAILGWDLELGHYSVQLHDGSGEQVHTWPIDAMSFSDLPRHRQNAPHAMEILADGSVIISFDRVGLVARVNPCGDAIWVREGFYHHSFAPAADGGIWTWFGERSAYGQVQDILKFDPDTGEDIKRISFTRDVIARNRDSALAFSMFPDFPFVPDDQKPRDIFHPNDVEELLPELAPAFPQFEAGDLMLSIRELDLIAIISPEGELKWTKNGPWLKQHDPDFEPDGRISIYDNSRFRPRSRIMTVDPATMEVTDALPGLEASFKSVYRGKHQLLPNGNRLVTIPEQGQAIEVTPDGKVAVEFNNITSEASDFNEDLANAKWLQDGFFDVQPECE
ncbi:arylsulfotransferase family protein [Thalassobium sp. R2A62]|uniref:arylsulfotransferase family protein n=1 Tax=Thalassobium sp. R2A62 TaxID=633131 RepID=UPI0001B1D1D2|nr:arylsulfotransferase family protein [Thalassobium sp. R2A62]EET47220.1 lipoprotein, putative [Thalassobium sp. R2A62]